MQIREEDTWRARDRRKDRTVRWKNLSRLYWKLALGLTHSFPPSPYLTYKFTSLSVHRHRGIFDRSRGSGWRGARGVQARTDLAQHLRARRLSASPIHTAKQIRRLGNAINVGAATPYEVVRATVRWPLSPPGRWHRRAEAPERNVALK